MTPAQRIRELIMCPLQRCYPAQKPKKCQRTPQGIARIVEINRRKTREWQSGLRM